MTLEDRIFGTGTVGSVTGLGTKVNHVKADLGKDGWHIYSHAWDEDGGDGTKQTFTIGANVSVESIRTALLVLFPDFHIYIHISGR